MQKELNLITIFAFNIQKIIILDVEYISRETVKCKRINEISALQQVQIPGSY